MLLQTNTLTLKTWNISYHNCKNQSYYLGISIHILLYGVVNTLLLKEGFLKLLCHKKIFCLFNDGSPTFLHSGHGTYSTIDLSFASPALFD